MTTRAEVPGPIDGVVETALYVDDLDRAETFYRRIFGFRCALADDRLRALELGEGQVLLLFLRGASVRGSEVPGGSVPGHDGRGQLHLALGIAAETVDAWRRHLTDLGIEIESEVEWPPGGHSLYVRDPDGHSIELVTPGTWPNY